MFSDLCMLLEASVEQQEVRCTIFASKNGRNIVPSLVDNNLGLDSIDIHGAKPICDQNTLITYPNQQLRMIWVVIFAYVER